MPNPIETTLAFDVDHYRDHEPVERIAEAVIEQGARRVEYIYNISHEGEEAELQVHSRYYLNGELRNESSNPQSFSVGGDITDQSYPVEDGVVYHADDGQELQEFISANAFADPEVSLTDEFESMVKVEA